MELGAESKGRSIAAAPKCLQDYEERRSFPAVQVKLITSGIFRGRADAGAVPECYNVILVPRDEFVIPDHKVIYSHSRRARSIVGMSCRKLSIPGIRSCNRALSLAKMSVLRGTEKPLLRDS